MHRVTLELDDDDARAIHQAVAYVQRSKAGLPDADEGNLIGRAVAEACRGFLDMLSEWRNENEG